MIDITENAIKAVKQISEETGVGHFTIRLRVIGGGCSGFNYDMYYEDKVSEMDEVFEISDIKVVVDPLSMQYLDGVSVDYVEGMFGNGFKFNNPNSKGSCGCGSSFSV
jgi:iron-sulfur cluster insertion protein